MSAAMVSLAFAAAQAIVGAVEGIRISSGLMSVTVLLGDDPVVTITPAGGQYVVKTLRSLEARPRKSEHVTPVASSHDAEWEGFATSRINDVRHALHLAEPRLRWRSETGMRIEAELNGDVETLNIDEGDPQFWALLATWVEVSGALPQSRNTAKWARIYGETLAKERSISERFGAWAMRTAEAARRAGFRPASRRRPASSTSTTASGTDPPIAVPSGTSAASLSDRELDAFCNSVRQLSADGARRLCEAVPMGRADPLIQIRARMIRRVPEATRRRARSLVSAAAAASPAAVEVPPDSWLGAAIDAADALIARNLISREEADLLQLRWSEVSGSEG